MPTSEQQQIVLPANVDAEKHILGCLLMNNALFSQVDGIISAEDFSLDSHRKMYLRIEQMLEDHRPADLATLAEELAHHRELEAIGGATFISSLTDGMPKLENIRHYAKIVKDKALLRKLTHIGYTLAERSIRCEDSPLELVSELESSVGKLAVSGLRGTGPYSIRDVMVRGNSASLDDFLQSQRRSQGLETGFFEFDDLTGGLQPGDLIISAARPSMGKTSWGLDVSRYVGLQLKLPVLFFSLEMNLESITSRLVCAEAMVNQSRMRGNSLSSEELLRISSAIARLEEAPIFLDDAASLDVRDMLRRSRKIQQEQGLSLVLLDYIGLMNAPRAENRTQEVAQLSRSLKALAVELQIPVIVLSQLNRASEERGGWPRLSDLRDSGALEQDADIVCFLFREEQRLKMCGQAVPLDLQGRADLVVAKQRNGPTGAVPLVFTGEWASFGGFHGGGNTA
ncbi:MAG: replicative DNA helicase [Acidobacteria bacterium]|nr:replicative DNA helicase [Acidobacteriota bacterium]